MTYRCGFQAEQEQPILIAANVDQVKDKHYYSAFLCHCGEVFYTRQMYVKTGNTTSCGCRNIKRTTKHSLSNTVEYKTWISMKARCYTSSHNSYPRYGGRGIIVCERWMNFENFYADMGKRPTAKHSLERKDNNGDYEPSNCVWATPDVQSNNTSRNIKFEYDGGYYSVTQLERKYGFNRGCIFSRLRRGWSIEKSITTPLLIERSSK